MLENGRKRLAILTEYDGSAFFGWQIQSAHRTVQQVLHKALIRLTGEDDLNLIGCSRTDTGVHARGHVSHFTTCSRIPVDRWPLALNSVLPVDICVHAAAEVPDDFNARYAARGKVYSYQIWNHPVRPAIDRRRVCHVPGQLDLTAMAGALSHLVGCRDYQAFCDAGSAARTTRRTVERVRLTAWGPEIRLYFQGDGFLYHMVRIMAGTLLAVGQGKLTAERIDAIIQSGDRRLAGKTMPPQGLCLEHVFYQPELFGTWLEPALREGEFNVQYALE
ncbi:MAG: tRNA pseudouridine(38-40) synthase TruA [Bacillota bacterium]|nr:tRNA pseudouridine(38-40) synthase TruA [Bacillota bacterium]